MDSRVTNEKVNSSKRQTIQSIKELVFNDSAVSLNEIQTIIIAKELDERVTIPYTFYEILTLCQLSFMEDRFLPLAKRQELINEMEVLKSQLPEKWSQGKLKPESRKSEFWLTVLLVAISLSAASAGIVSFYKKFRSEKEKQEEITNEIEDTSDKESSYYAREFEERIINVIRKRSDIRLMDTGYERGIDLQFSHDDRLFYVEIKYLSRSKIGLKALSILTNFLKGKRGEGWLIFNTDITPLVKRGIHNFNQANKSVKIRAIHVNNEKEFENVINELLGKENFQ